MRLTAENIDEVLSAVRAYERMLRDARIALKSESAKERAQHLQLYKSKRELVSPRIHAANGWIEWCGGGSPPVFTGIRVEIQSRDGSRRINLSHSFWWGRNGAVQLGNEIIRYRVVK